MGNVARYRKAEAALWADAGIEPIERWVELPTIGVRARVLEVGRGAPTLFLTGGPEAASTWSYAVAATSGVRCLLLDRPNTGLSEPLPVQPDASRLPGYVAQLTVDVLDGLGLDRVPVIGSSFGGFSALRSVVAHPDRVQRVLLAGCPAFVPGWREPGFFKVLRTPVLGRLALRAPATRASVRMMLRQMGEHRALAARRVPVAMLEWIRAWQRDTDTLRNDAAMILAASGRRGFDPSLDLDAEELASIEAPCHVYIGTDDPVGGADVGRNLASRVRRGSVEVIDGAGHLPWLDDPARFAAAVTSFVAGDADSDATGVGQPFSVPTMPTNDTISPG